MGLSQSSIETAGRTAPGRDFVQLSRSIAIQFPWQVEGLGRKADTGAFKIRIPVKGDEGKIASRAHDIQQVRI